MRPPVVAATALAVALLAASVAYAGQGTDPPSAHATPAFSILATLGGYPVETLKTGNAWRGRQSPLAASGYVGLPYVLANFQGAKWMRVVDRFLARRVAVCRAAAATVARDESA